MVKNSCGHHFGLTTFSNGWRPGSSDWEGKDNPEEWRRARENEKDMRQINNVEVVVSGNQGGSSVMEQMLLEPGRLLGCWRGNKPSLHWNNMIYRKKCRREARMGGGKKCGMLVAFQWATSTEASTGREKETTSKKWCHEGRHWRINGTVHIYSELKKNGCGWCRWSNHNATIAPPIQLSKIPESKALLRFFQAIWSTFSPLSWGHQKVLAHIPFGKEPLPKWELGLHSMRPPAVLVKLLVSFCELVYSSSRGGEEKQRMGLGTKVMWDATGLCGALNEL